MLRLFTTVATLTPLAATARSARFAVPRTIEFRQENGAPAILTSSPVVRMLSVRGGSQEYETLATPAPGSPFHYAFPVHDLELAKDFYGNVLGCKEGRSSEKWQDYSLHGHQIVAHWVGKDYRCQDYYNPVDGDEVPVPHTGLALTVEQFRDLANRLKDHGIQFIIEPHLRFEGQPGEQFTMVRMRTFLFFILFIFLRTND
jgi:extradiol dioxygenase family protein